MLLPIPLVERTIEAMWLWLHNLLVVGVPSIVAALVATAGLWKWLGQKWVEQRFGIRLERFKADQQKELEALKAEQQKELEAFKAHHQTELERFRHRLSICEREGWAFSNTRLAAGAISGGVRLQLCAVGSSGCADERRECD